MSLKGYNINYSVTRRRNPHRSDSIELVKTYLQDKVSILDQTILNQSPNRSQANEIVNPSWSNDSQLRKILQNYYIMADFSVFDFIIFGAFDYLFAQER
jgi:hypothetical protein